jgi:flavin-dependent dehydrogenase
MNQREERIVVETERYRFTGTVLLSAEGYRSRLTEHLNAGEHEFIALTDVEVVALGGGHDTAPAHHGYVALGRRHIVFATSAEAP